MELSIKAQFNLEAILKAEKVMETEDHKYEMSDELATFYQSMNKAHPVKASFHRDNKGQLKVWNEK